VPDVRDIVDIVYWSGDKEFLVHGFILPQISLESKNEGDYQNTVLSDCFFLLLIESSISPARAKASKISADHQ